jgi:hypothetical protein
MDYMADNRRGYRIPADFFRRSAYVAPSPYFQGVLRQVGRINAGDG